MRLVTRLGGLSTAGLLTIIGLLHVFWAVRGMSERSVVIPERDGRPVLRPSRPATLSVAACLFLAALTILARLSIVRLPAAVPVRLPQMGTWALAMMFALRAIGDFRYVGLFKRVRGTAFARWDSRLFVPLCLVMSAGSALTAISEPQEVTQTRR